MSKLIQIVVICLWLAVFVVGCAVQPTETDSPLPTSVEETVSEETDTPDTEEDTSSTVTPPTDTSSAPAPAKPSDSTSSKPSSGTVSKPSTDTNSSGERHISTKPEPGDVEPDPLPSSEPTGPSLRSEAGEALIEAALVARLNAYRAEQGLAPFEVVPLSHDDRIIYHWCAKYYMTTRETPTTYQIAKFCQDNHVGIEQTVSSYQIEREPDMATLGDTYLYPSGGTPNYAGHSSFFNDPAAIADSLIGYMIDTGNYDKKFRKDTIRIVVAYTDADWGGWGVAMLFGNK